MGITLTNNAHTTLSADASSTDTVIYVEDVDSFPTLDVDDYFYLTLERTSGALEIVKVTQINASSFNVVRGQENTIPISFSIGSNAKLNMTVQNITDLILTGNNIDDTAYSSDWNGDTDDAPSRNAVYDKIETVVSSVAALVSDTAYAGSWDGVTTIAPSKNAVYDKFEAIPATSYTWTAAQNFNWLAGGVPKVYATSGSAAGYTFGVGTAAGDIRWAILKNATTETGANAGSDLDIFTYTDAGSALDRAIRISRATGIVDFTYAPTVADSAYGAGWNGSLAVPTRNAVYDKIETLLPSASYTAADVLSKLLTVDGTGSGLDADLLDGSHASAFALLSGATFTGALAVGNGTITASAPVLDLAQTWNASGVTFTGMRFNVTNTASASASLLLDMQVDGASKIWMQRSPAAYGNVWAFGIYSSSNSGLILCPSLAIMGPNYSLNWGATGISAANWGAIDLTLLRDAANTLAQRNSTNAQTFRVYNTYTDASNYERLEHAWSSNEYQIDVRALGTGTQRGLAIGVGGNKQFKISSAGVITLQNNVIFPDNLYDIGASGATRPRSIYAATDIVAGGKVEGSRFKVPGIGDITTGGADGVLCLRNNAGADFGRLQFGGTTSSFPALKRSTTKIQVRLADDSAYAPLEVLDDAYAAGWDGSVEVPTKNAVYDKIQSLPALSDGDKGDITVSSSGTVWTVDANTITLAKMATMATDSILGRATAATGNVEVLTALPFAYTGDVTRAADSNTTVLAAGNAGNLNSGTLLAARMPALTGEVTTSAGAVATALAAAAITARTEDTAPETVADFVLTYDNSATALKKVLLKNLKTPECITIAVGDETTAITTGTAKVTWRMPYAFTVTAVRSSVNTVSSSGLPTVDINEAGVSILSTTLSIDASEKTSTTAATAAVISDTSIADDAEMTIDIDTAGTGAKGLKVQILGYRT